MKKIEEKKIITKKSHRIGDVEYPSFNHDDRHIMRNKIITHIGDQKQKMISMSSLKEFFQMLCDDPEVGKSPSKSWIGVNSHLIRKFNRGRVPYYHLTKQGKRLYNYLIANRGIGEIDMEEPYMVSEKSVSVAQQRLMGIAYSVKDKRQKLDDLPNEIRDEIDRLVNNMTKSELKKFASTSHDDLPIKIDEDPASFDSTMGEYQSVPSIYVDKKRRKI